MKKIIIASILLVITHCSIAQDWYPPYLETILLYDSTFMSQPDSITQNMGIYQLIWNSYECAEGPFFTSFTPVMILADADTAKFKKDMLNHYKLSKNELFCNNKIPLFELIKSYSIYEYRIYQKMETWEKLRYDEIINEKVSKQRYNYNKQN